MADGNSLDNGLQKCLMTVVDLRRNCKTSTFLHDRYLGNCIGANVIMPPLAQFNTSSKASAGHPVQQPDASTFQPCLADSALTTPRESSRRQQAHVYSQTYSNAHMHKSSHAAVQQKFDAALTVAACAVRKGTDGFRADPAFLSKQLAGAVADATIESWQAALATKGFSPQRDCALFISSWRKLSVGQADFGAGRPQLVLGCERPLQHRFATIIDGLDGDDVLCMLHFTQGGYDRLRASALLHHIAPEASFVQQVDARTLPQKHHLCNK